MVLTITNKNYLMFCAQLERNFILNLCITRLGIYVTISDHAGQIDTDLVSFDQPSTILLFLQMVMGFAFLPDKWLGPDHTIIHRVHDQKPSEATFKSLYPPFWNVFKNPNLTLIHSPLLQMGKLLAITTEEAQSDECTEFDTIAISGNTYKVLSVIFQSPVFIG